MHTAFCFHIRIASIILHRYKYIYLHDHINKQFMFCSRICLKLINLPGNITDKTHFQAQCLKKTTIIILCAINHNSKLYYELELIINSRYKQH